MCIWKTAGMLHKINWAKVTVYSIGCEHPSVYSTVLFLAQQSSGNYSEVCERQKYGELWINGDPVHLVSFYWLIFLNSKQKNAFVATALLRWLLLLLSLWFECLRKQTQADIHELITQLTEWLWEFLVSSYWWLNAAKTHAHLWLFCWLNWPSFFGATFLGFLFFSFQASPKYSCC